jgi:hypothetical protein
MISEKKELVCDRPKSCGKPATRVLRYNTRTSSGELEFKSEVFCDDHVEAEMKNLQKAALLSASQGSSKRQGIVLELSNSSLEDDCWHEFGPDMVWIHT